MMSVLSGYCRDKVKKVLDPVTGTHDIVDVAPWEYTNEPCFVAQEINFLGNSKLIFTEKAISNAKEMTNGTICIVCKTLRVIDGAMGCHLTQPDEKEWDGKDRNLITHKYTFYVAATGASHVPQTPPKKSNYNSNVYANDPNPAREGDDGTDGAKGNAGGTGKDALDIKIFVGTLVVQDALGKRLTIDFRGQEGGKGGKGQDGGEGGDGEKGRPGDYEDPWYAGPRCTRQPGPGGHGGDGGEAGDGGDGGKGGKGAGVEVYIPGEQELEFKDRVCIDNSGGRGGRSGDPGARGSGGKGGDGGDAPDGCFPVIIPSPGGSLGSPGNPGNPGSPGDPGEDVKYVDLVTQAEAEDAAGWGGLKFLLFSVDSVSPNVVSRGTTKTVDINGTGFEATPSVTFSGLGITVTSVTFVSASKITANITLASGAVACPAGFRDVTVKNPTGVEKTLTNALQVTA